MIETRSHIPTTAIGMLIKDIFISEAIEMPIKDIFLFFSKYIAKDDSLFIPAQFRKFSHLFYFCGFSSLQLCV